MLKFCQDHKGSISIFLLVIITAMLFFSFMTFDIAKINLASATARSNTDLVGNAILTDYDKILKETYGLLANSRNNEELAKNVTEYYLATMASNGIEVEHTTQIHKFISDLINSTDVPTNNNMLQLRSSALSIAGLGSDDDGIIIQPINESAISNPVVMRRQIVEYMKYRAPLSLALGVLEKINVLNDIGNQANATSARIEYEDALNEVQNSSDQVYEIYNAYKNNLNIAKGGFASTQNEKAAYIEYGACMETKISGSIKSEWSGQGLDALHESYNEFVEAYVRLLPLKDYMDYDGTLNAKGFKIEAFIPDSMSDWQGFIDAYNGTGESDGFTADIFRELRMHFPSDNDIFPTDASNFDNGFGDDLYDILIAAQPIYKYSTESGLKNDISIGGNSISENFALFYYDFYKLYYGCENATLTDTGAAEYAKYKPTITEIDTILSSVFGRPYVTLDKKTVCTTTEGKLPTLVKNLYNDANTKLKTYNKYMDEVGSEVFFQKRMAYFMCGGESPLDDLGAELKDADTKSDLWNDAIEGVDTEDYRASMRNTFNVEAKNFKEFDANSIQNIKNMFKQQFEIYEDAFNKITASYGKIASGLELMSFEEGDGYNHVSMPKSNFNILYPDNCNTLLERTAGLSRNDTQAISGISYSQRVNSRTVSDSAAPDVDIVNSEFLKRLEMGDSQAIYEIVTQISEKNIIKYVRDENGDIVETEDSKSQSTAANVENSKKAAESDKKTLEAKQDELEKDAEDAKPKESEKNSDGDSMEDVTKIMLYSEYIKLNPTLEIKNENEGTDVSNDYTGGGNYDVSVTQDDEGNFDVSAVTNVLKDVGELFGGLLEAGRDNLYVAEYLTGSFTCLTTGLKDGKEVTEESITGYTFNKDNTAHYRAELEYILYGQSSEFGNKAIAVATISGIRFVLNLVYSFTDSEICMFTDTTAASLGALIPFSIPVIKTVLHIVLAGAETSWDMIQLCKGNAVPIYKSANTWVCKATNIVKNVVDEGAEIVSSAAENMVDTLGDEASDFITEKSNDIDEYLNAKITDLKNMLKSKSIVPIREFVTQTIADLRNTSKDLETELNTRIDALFTKLIENIDAILDSEGYDTGSIEAQLLNGLRGIISDNLNGYSDQLKTAIKEGMKTPDEFLTNFETKLNGVLGDIEKKIDGLFDKASGAVSNGVGSIRDQLTKAAEQARDELKDLAKDGINAGKDQLLSALDGKVGEKISGRNTSINMGSGSGTTKKGGGIADYLTMTYKDYLYIFLMIGMVNGTESELERAAQLMQCNIAMNEKYENYDINKSVTMFNVYTSCKVKTSVIGRYADNNGLTMKNLSDGYYNITIRGFAGY